MIQHSLHRYTAVPMMKSDFCCMKYIKNCQMTILIVCLHYLLAIFGTNSLNEINHG